MNSKYVAAPLLAVALALPLAAQTPAPAVPPAPVVEMQDQFEQEHSVRDLRGAVVVLVYGDRAGAAANKLLGEQLHVHFHPAARGLPPDKAREAPVRPLPDLRPGACSPDVLVVPIACIGKVPKVLHGMIRARFREVSPTAAVWLDFEDCMKQPGFPFTAGVPNLVVLDAAGTLRQSHSGAVSDEQFARLAAVVEALRREAAGAK